MPHLLSQLEDELARSRKREAFWISVIVHIVIVLLIVFLPKFLPDWAQPHLLRASDLQKNKQATFITAPPDQQKPPEKVHTDKLSDKNRIAETRQPQIDRKLLDALRTRGDLRAPGAPAAPQPLQPPQQSPMPPQTAVQRMPQAPPPPAQQASSNSQWSLPQQKAQPQEQPRENPFRSPGSAGSMISQATRNVERGGSNGSASAGAGYGLGPADHRTRGGLEVLSDTQGIDVGPYLNRLRPVVEMNMVLLAPESARPPLMKHGVVTMRFVIMPDGKVTGMQVEESSGDVALDRAAWGSITASSPFPAFPSNMHLPYIEMLATMTWNATAEEWEASHH